MNRQQIIERLFELKSVDPSADRLYNQLAKKWIDEGTAEIELRKIDPNYISKDFLSQLSGKPVYKSISDYKKNKLSPIATAKMISSLITQVLIQHEKDPSISCKSLQVNILLDTLKNYCNSDDESIDTSMLDEVLRRFGWSDDQDDQNNEKEV